MKTMARRISKLEERFAQRRAERGNTPADMLQRMRERRRLRLAAEGREPEEYPPLENLNEAGDRPWSLAERMRRRRLQRLSLQRLD
jgi:hypothetical protein